MGRPGKMCGGGNERDADEEGAREIGEARMVVGTVFEVAEEVGESEIGEAKTVVGAVVVVAVGLERAVVAEEEGAAKLEGWKRQSPGGGIFVAGEEGVAVLKGLLPGGQMVLPGCRRKE